MIDEYCDSHYTITENSTCFLLGSGEESLYVNKKQLS